MNNAPEIPRDRFFAMTRLDENRAKSQLAKKAGVDITAVTNLAVWGNHSATQYPDFYNAKINGAPVTEKIADEAWLKGEFISSGATTGRGDHQGARCLQRRQRGERSGGQRAFNCRADRTGRLAQCVPLFGWQLWNRKRFDYLFPCAQQWTKLEVVQGLPVNEFSRSKIDATINELKEEKSLVGELLPK